MTRSTRKWLDGLLRALFSGFAGVVGVAFVDPEDFNRNELWNVLAIAVWMAGVQVAQFLARAPMPSDEIFLPPHVAMRLRDELNEHQLDTVFGGHAETVRKVADKVGTE
jgi:hypothetical protein